MKDPKEVAEKLLDEFMWCATSLGQTAPLAPEVTKDIVKRHIELLMPYLTRIDGEFHSTTELQDLHKQVLIELEKL